MRDRSVEKKSGALANRRLGFVVCGSIGAVDTVRAIRELRRHGASVVAFPTASALRFITAEALTWAAEQPAVVEAGPAVEYLEPFDGVVVAPLTLNSLAKVALGLCDSAAMLLVATALGERTPLLLVPTMHASMRRHPCYTDYRSRLEGAGASFLETDEEEGRQKMPPPERLAEAVIQCFKDTCRKNSPN